MKNIKIKNFNKIAMLLNILLLLIILLLVLEIKSINNELNKLQNNKLNIIQYISDLKEKSSNLTSFSRAYVVTSNNKLKMLYYNILNRRIMAWVTKTNSSYNSWNLNSKIKHTQSKDTQKTVLIQLPNKLPYTKEELKKLTTAVKYLNSLLYMENEAINSVVGLFRDKDGAYTVNQRPKKQYSIDLLHSKQYHTLKYETLKSFDNFLFMFKKRIFIETNQLNVKLENKFNILYFMFTVMMFLNILFFIVLKKVNDGLNKKFDHSIKEAIEENRQKDKLIFGQSKHAAMGEMIGSIAHQWRQPLNAIAGHVQMIEFDHEDNLIDNNYIKKFISDNMKIINFMSKTIDDFRDFFRVDKTKKEFNAKDAINATLNLISAQFDNLNISIEITGDNSCAVYGFESELQQVILNLLNNSKDELIHKKIRNGYIKINIFKEMNFTVFKIGDNAGGVPNEIIGRIFDPYYTTKEQGKGTGLGLYMSKMIVEDNMGGHISVENEKDGAVFTIIFIDK